MGILWFAQPQMKNIPRWAIALGGAGLLLVMRWPKLLLFALPIAALLLGACDLGLRDRAWDATGRRK